MAQHTIRDTVGRRTVTLYRTTDSTRFTSAPRTMSDPDASVEVDLTVEAWREHGCPDRIVVAIEGLEPDDPEPDDGYPWHITPTTAPPRCGVANLAYPEIVCVLPAGHDGPHRCLTDEQAPWRTVAP